MDKIKTSIKVVFCFRIQVLLLRLIIIIVQNCSHEPWTHTVKDQEESANTLGDIL